MLREGKCISLIDAHILCTAQIAACVNIHNHIHTHIHTRLIAGPTRLRSLRYANECVDIPELMSSMNARSFAEFGAKKAHSNVSSGNVRERVVSLGERLDYVQELQVPSVWRECSRANVLRPLRTFASFVTFRFNALTHSHALTSKQVQNNVAALLNEEQARVAIEL